MKSQENIGPLGVFRNTGGEIQNSFPSCGMKALINLVCVLKKRVTSAGWKTCGELGHLAGDTCPGVVITRAVHLYLSFSSLSIHGRIATLEIGTAM